MFDASLVRPLRRRALRKTPPSPAPDLKAGTVVLTMEGVLPVEYLSPGDRIITRAGARILRHVLQSRHRDSPAFRLGFDAPEVIYANGAEIATSPLC